MARVELRSGRFTPSRGLCGERVTHVENYLSQKSGEWDWRVDVLARRLAALSARVEALEVSLVSAETSSASETSELVETASVEELADTGGDTV